jgi:hypothetical protein
MGREASGIPVKWVKSNRVIAAFLNRGEDVKMVYVHERITRDDALIKEREEITRLCQAGFVLANHQYNEGAALDVDEIVRSVLDRASAPDRSLSTEHPVVQPKRVLGSGAV